MDRTHCRSSRGLIAALGFSAVFALPAFGFGQMHNEVALDLPELPGAMAVSADDSRIAIASSTTVELRDRAGILLQSFGFGALPEACCVRDLAFVGNELFIARSPSWDDREGAGGTLGGLYRWSGDPDEPPVDLPVGGCTDLAVSDAAGMIATSCAGAVQLWPLDALDQPIVAYDRPASAIALSDAGTVLAIADRPPLDQLHGSGEAVEAAEPPHLRIFELADRPMELASVELIDRSITQLAFLPDGSLLSLDADGLITVTELGKMTSRVAADNGPLSDGSDGTDRIAISPDGRLLFGDFGGLDAGVLIDLENGSGIDSQAAIPMRGAGLWAVTASGSVLWAGRPPTFPSAVLRWFDLPTLVPEPDPDPDPDK